MTHTAIDWRPAATRAMLERRAAVLARIRAFMAGRSIMEVETPILSPAGNPDPNIQSLTTAVHFPSHAAPRRYYLHTSPEFHMKRLLAAGSGPIYQVTRVFRDEEAGRIHQPEFTMLEWYQPGFDHRLLMDEVAALLQALGFPDTVRHPYTQVFERHAGLNPHTSTLPALQDRARQLGLHAATTEKSILLDLIFSHAVSPHLGVEHPQFVYDYPECQAALARIRRDEVPVAERFELFINGMEIANGYHELCDAAELAERFTRENAVRARRGLAPVVIDERLLAALRHCLPDCAGVALGVDRLLLALGGGRDLREILTFPVEPAADQD